MTEIHLNKKQGLIEGTLKQNSGPTFEETAKHVLKDCVISSYVNMTEMEE